MYFNVYLLLAVTCRILYRINNELPIDRMGD